MIKLRRWFIDKLVRIIERDLYRTPVKKTLDKDAMMQFYVNLWELPGFRQYCLERETRFIYALAKKDNEGVRGQRIENTILFSKAQAAHQKQEKLAKEQK